MVNYHPRRPIVNKELLQKVDYDKVFDIYTDRFSDANDYNFFFVGNLDKEATIKLCNTYLGSLPTKGGKGAYVNEHVTPPAGVVEKKVTMELEEPKSTVYINFNGTYKYSTKANFELKALEHILGLRYTETIREEEGGSYGVSVRATETKIPENRYNMRMYFDCSPDDVDKLTAIVYREIDIIKKDGPTQEDFQKTIEYFKKTRQEKLKENNYWLNVLVKKSYEGVDLSENKNYEDIVNSLSIESIKKAADTYLNAEQRVQIIMIPK